MAKQNIIAALDIGGGKITAVAATIDQQTNVVKILAGSEFVCDGISCGTISDIRAAASTIHSTLSYLEEHAGGPICSLYLALRGKHIETYTNRGSLTISRIDTNITPEDIALVNENAKSISLKNNFEILSTIPQAYYIDKEIMKNPEDMSGSSLEVDVHITTGLKTTFDNINKAVDRAKDWPLTGRVYGLLCLAEGVLSQEDKDVGALLIDMGKDTTSAGIYANNSLICSYDLDFGSDLITSDISKCLHISHKEAENIKIKYGVATPNSYENDNEEIVIPSLYNREETRINKDYLTDIIRPRVENIFQVVREKIQSSNFYEFANTAVLTGGGSLLPGIKEQARTSLNMKHVTCATIQNDLVECDEQFLNPKYATAVSLAYFVAKRQIVDNSFTKSSRRNKPFSSILEKVKGLELFGD